MYFDRRMLAESYDIIILQDDNDVIRIGVGRRLYLRYLPYLVIIIRKCVLTVMHATSLS